MLRSNRTALASFASPQPDGLAVLLQLRDQSIPLLHQIRILLVLVVGPVSLDDAVDAVYCARYPFGSNKLGQIPAMTLVTGCLNQKGAHGPYLSKKSTVTPKSFAMLFKPTTR